MRLGRVVGFVNIDLFNSGFHVEVFIKDDRAEGEVVTHVGTRVTAKRRLSFRYSVHPFSEVGLRIAIGAVPHTIVEGGTRGRIETLSVPYQHLIYHFRSERDA
uniref:Uncharacterized protein n=1 Tax=Romanomermis culicivorax TaxID=13658 RepID=A0A915JHU7_ROMCU